MFIAVFNLYIYPLSKCYSITGADWIMVHAVAQFSIQGFIGQRSFTTPHQLKLLLKSMLTILLNQKFRLERAVLACTREPRKEQIFILPSPLKHMLRLN